MTTSTYSQGDITRAEYRLADNPAALETRDIEALRAIDPEMGARAERARKAAAPLPDGYRWSHAISSSAEDKLKEDPAALTDLEIQHLGWEHPLRSVAAAEKRHAALEARKVAAQKPPVSAAKPRHRTMAEGDIDRVFAALQKAYDGDRSEWEAVVHEFMTMPVPLALLDAIVLRSLMQMDQKNRRRNERLDALEARMTAAESRTHLDAGTTTHGTTDLNRRLADIESAIAHVQPGTATATLAQMEQRLKAVEARPAIVYQGLWDATKTYEAGECVTYGGSMWIARRQSRGYCPEDKSATDRVWSLSVMRGREGRCKCKVIG